MGITWIICPKSQYDVTVRVQNDSVPSHGDRSKAGRCDIRVLEDASLFLGTPNRLKIVAVKMKRMLPGIQVIHNNLYNLTSLQNEGMCVLSIDRWVGCQVPSTQRRV